MQQVFDGYTPPYNLWLVNKTNPMETRYCSTVLADDMQEAVALTIVGCDLKVEELVNWRWTRGNPRFNTEEQELVQAYVLRQLG